MFKGRCKKRRRSEFFSSCEVTDCCVGRLSGGGAARAAARRPGSAAVERGAGRVRAAAAGRLCAPRPPIAFAPAGTGSPLRCEKGGREGQSTHGLYQKGGQSLVVFTLRRQASRGMRSSLPGQHAHIPAHVYLQLHYIHVEAAGIHVCSGAPLHGRGCESRHPRLPCRGQ